MSYEFSVNVYPSNFLPLWAGAFDATFLKNFPVTSEKQENLEKLKPDAFKDKVVEAFEKSGLVQIGGILTSNAPTGMILTKTPQNKFK